MLLDKSVDMILCDLPYGVTARNKWDSVIDFKILWEEYKRVIKDNGAIVLFGQDKFTSKLMLSNEKMHRYNLIWDKVLSTGFLNANRMYLRRHEDICIFYKKLPTYNPQKIMGKKSHSKGNKIKDRGGSNYNKVMTVDNSKLHGEMKFPTSILTFEKDHPSVTIHPTQKPAKLFEHLIKTYTNEGETVLDNCMGSGTTAVAAINTNRNFIGFEISEEYCAAANQRINNLQKVLQVI